VLTELSGTRQKDPVPTFREHGNNNSDSGKEGNFLNSRTIIDIQEESVCSHVTFPIELHKSLIQTKQKRFLQFTVYG
jgi:hypothetical protein